MSLKCGNVAGAWSVVVSASQVKQRVCHYRFSVFFFASQICKYAVKYWIARFWLFDEVFGSWLHRHKKHKKCPLEPRVSLTDLPRFIQLNFRLTMHHQFFFLHFASSNWTLHRCAKYETQIAVNFSFVAFSFRSREIEFFARVSFKLQITKNSKICFIFQDYNDPCPYSLSPVTIKSQKLLRSPRKATRKISRIPFKVLDAPELQDDFYLNLVDWSAQNVLAVGLGSCVYLWSACTSQVSW